MADAAVQEQVRARYAAAAAAVSSTGRDALAVVDAEVVFTHEAAPGMHGALVRATKPACGFR